MSRPRDLDRGSLLLLAGAVLVGSVLRLYGIRDQLLVSDEWHALHAVAQTSPRALLRLVTIGASAIPLNLYYRLLLDGVGWSEMSLRLPSLVAGVVSLVLLPLLVWSLVKPRATVLFAYLMALSPLLTFYSRYCRPYSLVVLLTFVSLIACYRWAVGGRMRDAAVFASFGAVAGYLHIPELRSIVLPVLLLVLLKWWAGSGPDRRTIRPSFAALTLAGLVPTLLVLLLLLPGLLGRSQFLTVIVGRAWPDMTTLWGLIELLSGSAHPLVRGLFVALAALGIVLCLRRDRLLAGLLLVVVAGACAMLLILRPLDSELPIAFARYAIAIFPVVFLAAAVGIDGVLTWAERRSALSPAWSRVVASGAAAAVVAAMFLLGPLPGLYAGRNDFTNHKVFQATYGPLGTNPYARGFSHLLDAAGARAAVIPAFYDRLAAERSCEAIIEYPLPIGDLNSPYFLYQARHQKRVLGGYFHRPSPLSSGIRPGVVPADRIVDEVLAEVGDPTKLRFRNLVDLGDPAAMRASRACYLVVHTDLATELGGACRGGHPASLLGADYLRRFGQPVFSDACTTVFDLRASPQ